MSSCETAPVTFGTFGTRTVQLWALKLPRSPELLRGRVRNLRAGINSQSL